MTGSAAHTTNFTIPRAVLRGDMSLVGPRPHAVAHDDHFIETVEDYAYHHHVKPGMTGWAQAHGYRGETKTQQAIERRGI